jgi:hypothetical protein
MPPSLQPPPTNPGPDPRPRIEAITVQRTELTRLFRAAADAGDIDVMLKLSPRLRRLNMEVLRLLSRAPRACWHCGVTFAPNHDRQRYCTQKCQLRAHHERRRPMAGMRNGWRASGSRPAMCGLGRAASRRLYLYALCAGWCSRTSGSPGSSTAQAIAPRRRRTHRRHTAEYQAGRREADRRRRARKTTGRGGDVHLGRDLRA